MMALSKKMLEQEPSEIEMLLPWHAAGTLNARDARRVEEALARDPDLARQYKISLVPFLLQGVAGIDTLNQRDGIHPTAEGARILAGNIWPVLRPMLTTS